VIRRVVIVAAVVEAEMIIISLMNLVGQLQKMEKVVMAGVEIIKDRIQGITNIMIERGEMITGVEENEV